jgi:hypothetical protein
MFIGNAIADILLGILSGIFAPNYYALLRLIDEYNYSKYTKEWV